MAEIDQSEQEEKETETQDDKTSVAVETKSLTPQDSEAIIEPVNPKSDFEPQESNSVNENIAVTVR